MQVCVQHICMQTGMISLTTCPTYGCGLCVSTDVSVVCECLRTCVHIYLYICLNWQTICKKVLTVGSRLSLKYYWMRFCYKLESFTLSQWCIHLYIGLRHITYLLCILEVHLSSKNHHCTHSQRITCAISYFRSLTLHIYLHNG